MPDEFAPFPTGPQPSVKRPMTGLTVLVVEDSRFASEALRLLCLRSGARIRRASSLTAARRHLRVYRPSVVIVDIGLPDGSGTELIAELSRAQPRVTALIGISGDADGHTRAMTAGADCFLEKPIASLAAFQTAVLACLPESARPAGPRILSYDPIEPDPLALQDDLAHVAEILSFGADDETLDYIAQFVAGLARSAGDAPLEAAAQGLALQRRAGHPYLSDLARVTGLVQDRLATNRMVI